MPPTITKIKAIVSITAILTLPFQKLIYIKSLCAILKIKRGKLWLNIIFILCIKKRLDVFIFVKLFIVFFICFCNIYYIFNC